MNRSHALTAVAVLSVLRLAACGGGADHGTDRSDARLEVATRWTVRIGSQGGFTGGGSGHLVHSDGRVQSWSQITPDDSFALQDVGRANAETVRALADAMTDPALGSIQHQKTGNLTGFLEWIEDTGVRRYSWAERRGEPDLPVALQRAVAAARSAVESARE